MIPTFRRQASFAALLLGLTTLAGLPPTVAHGETLPEAVKTAITTFPSIDEAKANRRAQDFELKQQRGLYLPSLDIAAGAGPEWSYNQSAPDGKTMPRYESAATLSLMLFDGFGRESAIDRSASRVDAAASRVLERSEAVAANAIEAYLNVLRNIELVKLAEDNVAAHRTLQGRVGTRVRGGQSGAGDLQQANSRVSAAEDTLVQARRDLKDSHTVYIQILNEMPEDLSRYPLPKEALPESIDQAVLIALNSSPTLEAAGADLDEAGAVHRQARAGFWPRFDAVVGGTANRNVDGVRGEDNDASAMLRMRYNLFRGNIDQNLRMETAERVSQARAAVLRLERAVAKETRDSWNAMEAAQLRFDVLGQQVVANSQVVSSYRQEFDINQRSLLDLLDSENELFTARTRATTAEYAYEYSVYRTLAAMGQLTRTLAVEVPKEALGKARQDAGVDPERTAPFITRQPGYEMTNATR